jgi:hypothetical protein
MPFTKAEVYEYLQGYPQDTIPLVLSNLGFDEGDDVFPENVIQSAEEIYQTMGMAADTHKKLSAAAPTDSPQSIEIQSHQIEAIGFQLLEQRGISLPIEIIAAIARAKVEESIELADRISQLQERSFAARLTSNQAKFAQKLLTLSERATEEIDGILSDEAQAEWISAIPQAQLNGEVGHFIEALDGRAKAKKQLVEQQVKKVDALPFQDPAQIRRAFIASMKK